MGSLILRPTETISSSHTKYPSGSLAHNCVNEASSDGDSTYLQQSVSSTTNTNVDSRLRFSGKFPSKHCTITKITVYATAKTSTTSLANRRVNYILHNINGVAETSTNIKYDLTTSYATYSKTIDNAVAGMQLLIQNDGTITFEATVRTVGQKGTGSKASSGTLRVTQFYFIIEYEEIIESLLVKVNGKYENITKMFVKENGVWVQKNLKEWFQGKSNNSKFGYIYGGDLDE